MTVRPMRLSVRSGSTVVVPIACSSGLSPFSYRLNAALKGRFHIAYTRPEGPLFHGYSSYAAYLPSMLVSSSVMVRASSGRPVMWAMLRRRVVSSGFRSSRKQGEQLGVAVLLDDVDAVVLFDELVHFAGERIGAKAEVIGLHRIFVAKLVAAFGDAPVGSAVSR